ncbi:MAG: Na+/H+ antiporter NhaC family protein [Spirochaetota bacterium]|nr:Na+/H+ antiporter NhaC family protein [Spirochaetota bacterium]
MLFKSIIFSFILTPSFSWGSSPEENAITFGLLTLIPPVLSILLAFITKNVYSSLLCGIWAGALLLSKSEGFFTTVYNSFEKMIVIIITVLSDSWSATIIAQLITISGMIAIISKNGGSFAIASTIAKKAKTARSAQIFTCFTALFIFFDDYANCLITGPVMKTITDKLKVSREKLSFLVDSTAAPIAGIALISTWIGYELGVLRDAYIIAGVTDPNTYQIFIQTLPYRFYNFFILGFLFIIAFLNKDFGPMLHAEQRARQKGIMVNSSPSESIDDFLIPDPKIVYKMSNALIPLSVLILGTFFGIWYDGYRELVSNNTDFSTLHGYDYMLAILGSTDVIVVILKASILASIVAIMVSTINKSLSLFEAIKIWIIGAQNLTSTVIILILAWSISAIIKEIGTSAYIITILQNNIPVVIIPTITFILASIIAFSTGTSYGTMGILMPLAIPLVATLSGDANSTLTTITAGTVLTGAIVGDHCSPISDTTILSAGGAGCPLIDHVNTQLPYTIFVASISIVCGYLFIALGLPIIVSYVVGFISMITIVFFIGKHPDTEPIKE